MILDAYQSAGVVPLDVTALGVDFAVGGSVKWLLGGPGNGWLYVRPDLERRLEPTVTGWQAHEDPFAFEEELRVRDGRGAVPHGHAERAGALRGDGRLRPGRGGRRRRASARTRSGRRSCSSSWPTTHGFEVRSPRDPERRGGTVTVHVPEFAAVHRELAERQVICDFRPDAGLRLGPHFFTSDDELRHAIDQIADIVETAARTAATSARSRGTERVRADMSPGHVLRMTAARTLPPNVRGSGASLSRS